MENRFALGMHSVRTRLVLLNVAVLALTLLILGVAVRYTLQVNLSAEMDRGIVRFSNRLLDSIPVDRLIADSKAQGKPIEFPPAPPGHSYQADRNGPFGEFGPAFFDPMGRPIVRSNTLTPWDRTAFAQCLNDDDKVWSTKVLDKQEMRILTAPVKENGQIVAVLQIARPTSFVSDQIGRVTGTLLTLAPIALIFATILGLFLVGRALQPVRLITQAAATIEAQNLDGRLDVTGRDEFSELADTFNSMLGRLQSAFVKLEASYEQQRRFTADASHELRTPLSIIKANTSLALSSPRPAEQYHAAIEAIDSAADRSNALIRDLMFMARADADAVEFELTPIPIDRAVEAAVEIVGETDGARIQLELAAKSLGARADEDAIIRVVVNLLQNAKRYTAPDGVIRVVCEQNDRWTTIKVIDPGEGIPAESLPHVFERFYRVDPSRSRHQGGTGLGLAICKAIVDAHDGTIEVESKLGVGTTVTVALPAAKVAAPQRQVTVAA